MAQPSVPIPVRQSSISGAGASLPSTSPFSTSLGARSSLPSTSPSARAGGRPRRESIVETYYDPRDKELEELMKSEPEDVSIALVAIKALIKTISNSKATTMMGLQEELEAAIQRLQRSSSSFALHSGCELFLRFVTRTSDEIEDFERCKQRVLSRGERFLQMAGQCRSKINVLADRFIRDGVVVLTHGYSRVVHSLLVHAASKNKRFRVIVSESRPDNAGYKTIKRLTEAGITCNLITDAGVAYAMEEVDIVIIGAEAVVENGGIMNKLGSFQVSIVAHAFGRPVYVAAESFKFTRLFPLSQRDSSLDVVRARAQLEKHNEPLLAESQRAMLPNTVRVDSPLFDYTPPAYISLLFTDLGTLTPSAVSDELIKLYY